MSTTEAKAMSSLRNLYIVRTVVQAIWAAVVIAEAATHPLLVAVFFLLYPLWDVACTVYDLETSSPSGPARRSQSINAFLGTIAALGIGLTVFDQPIYAVAVFGAWALAAGALQLTTGIIRRKQELGGQWAMMLSGTQSMIAGVAYLVGGLLNKRHIRDVGGYAIFGAVYFLIAGILLTRKLPKTELRGSV